MHARALFFIFDDNFDGDSSHRTKSHMAKFPIFMLDSDFKFFSLLV